MTEPTNADVLAAVLWGHFDELVEDRTDDDDVRTSAAALAVSVAMAVNADPRWWRSIVNALPEDEASAWFRRGRAFRFAYDTVRRPDPR